jgi:hypothetical protein
MATFDRFDICEAYLAVEYDWNKGGWVHQRPHTGPGGRPESIDVQVTRLGFKPGAAFRGWESLTENGRAIYDVLCERWHLDDGGYKDCACRDCFEIAIGYGRPLCHECVDAGCDPTRECQAPGAYGEDDGEDDGV